MKTARTLGNHGRLLKIDLTRQDIQTEQLSESDLRLFMGGRGLGAAIMLRELPAGIDPLGEENLLIFSTGPLVDSPVPGSNRYVLHTKSPQTGLYSFSVSGGHFGAMLKKTGNDVIVIKGKASKKMTAGLNSKTHRIYGARIPRQLRNSFSPRSARMSK